MIQRVPPTIKTISMPANAIAARFSNGVERNPMWRKNLRCTKTCTIARMAMITKVLIRGRVPAATSANGMAVRIKARPRPMR